PSGWWQAADRREASEGAVASPSVVVVEPWDKRGGSFVVGGEDVPVCPFGLQGSVEPFDFAVLPGAVRPDEHMGDRMGLEQRRKVEAAGVAPVVVGHHGADVWDAGSVELL